MGAGPVQEVEVEAIGAEPLQRFLARFQRACARRVARQHLGDEEDFVTTSLERAADEVLDASAPVEFGGVDVGHAEVETRPERGDGVRLAVVLHQVRALPDDRNRNAGPAERALPRAHLPRAARMAASAARALLRVSLASSAGTLPSTMP